MLKLFVWRNVLCDHTSGIAFALAHDVNEARDLIMRGFEKENAYQSDQLLEDLLVDPQVFDETFGIAIYGGA